MSNAAENGAIVASKTAAYGGSGAAVISGLTYSELGVVVGIVVAVLGLVLGQYWAWRRDRREERELQARLCNLGDCGRE